MKDAIMDFLNDRLTQCRAFADGQEPTVSLKKIDQHLVLLRKKYGEYGVETIWKRSVKMIGEIIGGEAAPPLANLNIEGQTAVEVDIAAELIVKAARQHGVRPSKDPAWRDTVNRGWQGMIERYTNEVETRATPKPVTPPPNLESLVQTAVNRALDERMLHVRTGPGGAPIPPMRYLGVWRGGGEYQPGDVVTHKGVQWSCALFTSAKPGTNADWQLTMKGNLSETQARAHGL